jgi:hypothetical protein
LHRYTGRTISEHLGFKSPPDKVTYALAALELIEKGVWTLADFEGLTNNKIKALVIETNNTLNQGQYPSSVSFSLPRG